MSETKTRRQMCRTYMSTGTCQYGDTCRFVHSNRKPTPRQYHNTCPKCRTKTMISDTKNTHFMCDQCSRPAPCDLCGQLCPPGFGPSQTCQDCYQIRYHLTSVVKHGHTDRIPDTIDVYPGLHLFIKYRITRKSHSGYCSDTCESYPPEIVERKIMVPLLKKFKMSDIDEDNTIMNHSLLYKYYLPENSEHHCCRCGTSYDVIKAYVRRQADMIILDD